MSTTLNEITNLVKNLKPSSKKITFKPISWPYSRDFITAICKIKGLEFDYKRLDKRFDEFKVGVDVSFEPKVRKMLRLINKEANLTNNPTQERKRIAAEIADELIAIEDEIREHIPTDEDFVDDEAEEKTSKKSSKKKAAKAVRVDADNDDEDSEEKEDDFLEDDVEEAKPSKKVVIKKAPVKAAPKKVLRKK